MRILIVDDNDPLRLTLMRAVRDFGEVDGAQGCAEAFEKLVDPDALEAFLGVPGLTPSGRRLPAAPISSPDVAAKPLNGNATNQPVVSQTAPKVASSILARPFRSTCSSTRRRSDLFQVRPRLRKGVLTQSSR